MIRKATTRAIVFLIGWGLTVPAWSQVTVIQTLDSVKVNSSTTVLDMPFNDPRRTADFFNTGITGSNFRACKLTALSGLFCLDGASVINWTDVTDPLSDVLAVDCADPVLNLDTKKGAPCTGMTVALDGSIKLATKTKGKTHSLVDVVDEVAPGMCPAGYVALANTPNCAREVATGRPLLVDITSIDGDFGAAFPFGPGTLGLEERKTAVYFPVAGAPVEIRSGKNAWGLAGREQLLSIAAVQVTDSASVPFSYLLVTTTNGRILASRADGSGSAVEVFDIVANRDGSAVQCDFDDANFGIRASTKSGLIYVTDREFCLASALVANSDASGNLIDLEFATEPVFDAMGNPIGVQNVVLSTSGGGETHPPEGPTVAPGIAIDLDDCAGICTLVVDAQGNPAATLANVQLASLQSGLTLFQVKNIPDCRYTPVVCQNLLGVPDLFAANVIDDPDGVGQPVAQLLNLTKLLPMEVTDLFAGSGGLSDLWLPGPYRGQKDTGFTFEAFFGVTEDGVIFRDTFIGVFDVQALAGSELGCRVGLPDESPLFTIDEGLPTEQWGTLEWDVVASVSERYATFTDPAFGAPPQFIATTINSDCGSSQSSNIRWSIKPYNLEITPCTYNGDPNDVWATDGSCPVGGPETPDDAVFAKLLLQLFDDWRLALDQLACTDFDGAGSPPLSASACASLRADWINAKDKLDKCWDATQQPKQSAGSQNCQAFDSQLTGLRSAVAGTTLNGPDPANRRGELDARLQTIDHIRAERFEPSIPAGGFVEP